MIGPPIIGMPPRYPDTVWPQRRAARLASHTATGTSASSEHGRTAGSASVAIAAGHHRVLVEAALERAVVEDGLARGLEADQLRELGIAGEDVRGPAGELLLEEVAQLG